MNSEEVVKQAGDIFSSCLAEWGFELIELTYRYENGKNVLRALVDKPTGGINLDDCARLNRQLGQVLEEKDLIPEEYNIEVNSPGLDRPLRTDRDFARNMGRQIKVFLREPVNGKIEVDGTASEVSSHEVTLLTKDGPVSLPLEKINKAKLLI